MPKITKPAPKKVKPQPKKSSKPQPKDSTPFSYVPRGHWKPKQ